MPFDQAQELTHLIWLCFPVYTLDIDKLVNPVFCENEVAARNAFLFKPHRFYACDEIAKGNVVLRRTQFFKQ